MDRLIRYLLYAVLTIFIVTGFFTRVESDDYCVAALVDASGVTHGDVPSWVVAMYQGWNGRFSQLILHGLAARFDPLANMLIPALLILAAVACLWQLVGGMTALALTAAGLLAMPDPPITLYWLSSSMTYVAPLVVLLMALVIVKQGTRYTMPLLLSLGIVAGGFGETSAVILGVIWLSVVGLRRVSLVFAAGLVIGLIVVLLAPGNAVRAAYFPERDLNSAFYAAWDWWLSTPAQYPAGLAGYALGFAAGLVYPLPNARRRVVGAWAMAMGVTFATMLAIQYAAGWGYRPPRLLFIPAMLWVWAWYVTGSALVGRRKPSAAVTGMKLLMGVLVIVGMVAPASDMAAMHQYSMEWDARDRLIRSGVTTLPALDNPRHTLGGGNVCEAVWYGVNEIVVK